MKNALFAAGLVLACSFSGRSGPNPPAIVNFHGAPLNPAAPFPGLHGDEANVPPGSPVTSTTPSVSYVDGTENVAAFFFSGTGNAGMQTPSSSSQPIVRRLYLDLSNGPLPSGTYPFGASTMSGMIHEASSGPSLISQEMLNANLTCCDNNGLDTLSPTTNPPRYARLTVNFADPLGRNIKWALRWGPSIATPGTTAYLQTAASVDSSGVTTWTVNTVSDGTVGFPCQTNCDLAELSYAPNKPNGTYTVQGFYRVPVLFTIRRK